MAEIPAYVQEILRKMTDGGFEAWCVGGCVRDMLLGRVPGDLDVTASARPEEIIGRKLDELMGRERFWTPSTLPYIYENKKSILQMQKTYMGIDIETIGVPILDESGEILIPGFYDEVPELPDALRKQWDALGFDEKAFLGGVGLSGMGKYYGKAGFDALSNTKALLIGNPDLELDVFPPYAGKDIAKNLSVFS